MSVVGKQTSAKISSKMAGRFRPKPKSASTSPKSTTATVKSRNRNTNANSNNLRPTKGYNNKAQAFLSRGAQVIIRMRGLPFTCTAQQVVDFFSSSRGSKNSSSSQKGCHVLGDEEGVLFVKNHEDKPTGDAFVLFASEESAQRALQKHHENIGSRYVELFRSSVSEVQQVLSISMDSLNASNSNSASSQPTSQASRSNQQQQQQTSSKQQQQQQLSLRKSSPQALALASGNLLNSNSWPKVSASSSSASITYAQVATGGAASGSKQEQQPAKPTTEASLEAQQEPSQRRQQQQRQETTATAEQPVDPKSQLHASDASDSSSAFDNNSVNTSTNSTSTSTCEQVNDSRLVASADVSAEQILSSSAQSPVSTLSASDASSAGGSSYRSSSQCDAGSSSSCGAAEESGTRHAYKPVLASSSGATSHKQPHHHRHSHHHHHHRSNSSYGGRSSQSSASSNGQHQRQQQQYHQQQHHHQQVAGRFWHQQQQHGAIQHQQQVHLSYHQQGAALDVVAASQHYQAMGPPMQPSVAHQQYVTGLNVAASGQQQQAVAAAAAAAAATAAMHMNPAAATAAMAAAYHHQVNPYAGAHQQVRYPMPFYPHQQHPGGPMAMAAATHGADYNQPQNTSKRDCVRLRGLPFEAQVEDVLHFLGERSKSIVYQGIHMVYSAQHQFTGEAIIQMVSCAAATATAQEFHKKVMSVGKKQRYIEVIPSSIDDLCPMLSLELVGHRNMCITMNAAPPLHHLHQPATSAAYAPADGAARWSPGCSAAIHLVAQQPPQAQQIAAAAPATDAKLPEAAVTGQPPVGEASGDNATLPVLKEVGAVSGTTQASQAAQNDQQAAQGSQSDDSSPTPAIDPVQQPAEVRDEKPTAPATAAAPQINHLMPTAAAAAAAATAAHYYPILYYYPPQQMLAPPYH